MTEGVPDPEEIRALVERVLKTRESLPPKAPLLAALWSATCKVCTATRVGSGFFVEPDVVVTNAHVVDGSRDSKIETFPGVGSAAHLIAIDYPHDLALLRVPDASNQTLLLGESPTPGEDVWVCGHPLGSPGRRLHRGVVSGYGVLPSDGFQMIGVVLDAVVHPGNSGGPIVSAETGQVVGVAARIAAPMSLTVDVLGALSKAGRLLAEQIAAGIRATTGIAFGIDPGFVSQMLEAHRSSPRQYRRGASLAEPATFVMPRAGFVALQIAAAKCPQAPEHTSVLGVYSSNTRHEVFLGWGNNRVLLEGVPDIWREWAAAHLPRKGHFLLEGYRVLVRVPEGGGFVPVVELDLSA